MLDVAWTIQMSTVKVKTKNVLVNQKRLKISEFPELLDGNPTLTEKQLTEQLAYIKDPKDGKTGAT